MTAPRCIVGGATTLVTRRTAFRKAFLGAWAPEVRQVMLYALADAQRETGIAVHQSIPMVTHHHTGVTPRGDELPEFSRRFHRDVSCALNVLLARERYDAPGDVFDARPPHYLRLVDPAAQLAVTAYVENNPVAAGFVARPEEMPGHLFAPSAWRAGRILVKRPDVYFRKTRPEELELLVTPPPALLAAFDGDVDRLAYHLERLCEARRRALRDSRQGRPLLGPGRVRQMHPWSEPKTLRERGGERVPTFAVGAPGEEGRDLRIRCAVETRAFREHHELARQRWVTGDREAVFPFGTYAMRRLHSAVCEERPEPGSLLVGSAAENADAFQTLADARAFLDEVEAHEPSEDGEEYAPSHDSEGRVDEPEDPPRPPAKNLHRFDDAPPRNGDAPRRLIVHRDRRRAVSRRGSDPPR